MNWECGEDFCEQCGDCMRCYGDVPCAMNDSGPHEEPTVARRERLEKRLKDAVAREPMRMDALLARLHHFSEKEVKDVVHDLIDRGRLYPDKDWKITVRGATP